MATAPGRKVFIYIDLNGVGGGGANWAKIGQQRGGSFKRGLETADATHKDDDGWASAEITRKTFSISVDGALKVADPAWDFLQAAHSNGTKVFVRRDATQIGSDNKEGRAIITDLSEEFPESDVVTYTCEVQGDGPLT